MTQGNEKDRQPWEWRKALGGWKLRSDTTERLFHAYDESDHAACEPLFGLNESCEEPNEGSHLCPACVAVVEAHPGGLSEYHKLRRDLDAVVDQSLERGR